MKFGKGDVFARIGGDEFVGIFWDIQEDVLIKKIEQWKRTFDTHPIVYEGYEMITQFSYGIAELIRDGQTFEELLNQADKRMYQQKRLKE